MVAGCLVSEDLENNLSLVYLPNPIESQLTNYFASIFNFGLNLFLLNLVSVRFPIPGLT